ncbi:cutinase family protein [Nocardia suismassiliense]|uniref:cutinase family protein n=1 Tax=Nocardia suismassiliense TaxID=2077092 RepID=UPI000D1D6880|nr:cutinase family protein [Nocardia suismassiliense]
MRSSKRYVVTTLVTVGVAVGSSGTTAVVHAEPPTCAATFNLFIPGTWETDEDADPARPIGMLAPIAEAIQRQQGPRSEIYFTPYMARAFDNGYTYADSKNTALENATAALRDYGTRCPTARFTINGYSQGADAAGDLAAAIGNDRGPVPADRVLAVGLLADPGAGTPGETIVGPGTAGTGIADPRPQGMGKLSGRVTSICDPKDLYCSIQKSANPLLGALGSILSKALSGGAPPPDANFPIGAALTSDFSKADLPGLATTVAGLTAGLAAPSGVDLAQVRGSAEKLLDTLNPLVDLIDSGAANPAATAQLVAAPTGTAERDAGEVLTQLDQSDLSGAVAAMTTIADTATELLDNGVGTLRPNSPKARSLRAAAKSVRREVAPLAAASPETLGAATRVLSLLKPTVLVDQALDVAADVTTFDFPRIIDNLLLLPQKIVAMDAEGANQVAAELNDQLQPLLKLVGTVDLKWISQVLSVIPDAQGFTEVAAQVTSILSNFDITRLVQIIGRIQDVAWSVLTKLVPPPGQAPDLAGAGVALSGLLPIGADLAAATVDLLTGKAQQTPPVVLGRRAGTPAKTIAEPNLDLEDLTGPLSRITTFHDINLVNLIVDGLSAANFVASGAHVNYGSLVVDGAGRNAVQWLGDWMNQRIGHVK